MSWSAGEASGWEASSGWGNETGFQADENANPNAGGGQNGWGAAQDSWDSNDFDPTSAKPKDDDNKCRNCGGDGHFARNCPEGRKDSGCFNCGQEGHSKADCPQPPKAMACFNCGEEGHTKAECPKPRVFKGPCRICEKEGHPAAECPDRPPDVCKNCKMEGHKTLECTDNRKFDLNSIPDKMPEDAWAVLKKASDERDLEDFREGFKVYSKAVPQATFVDIEKKMREENFSIYLIAMEKEVGDVISLIDLQGKLGCQYVVGFYYSSKAQRQHLRERWPASVEDNLERLADAGFPYDRQVPKCGNCNEMGHTARGCKEERNTSFERPEVKCFNCNGVGHRVRDCPEPRHDKFACRNCGSPEHKASECTEPRSAEGVECRKCNQTGHFAKDCPQASAPRTCRNCGSEDHIAKECDQPRDVSTVTCRNCDEVGHFSRECPKKRDYSRVQCRECGEMGHTVKRCPKVQEGGTGMGDTAGGGDWNTGNDGMDTGNGGDWDGGNTAAGGSGGGDWDTGNDDGGAADAGNGWAAGGAGW